MEGGERMIVHERDLLTGQKLLQNLQEEIDLMEAEVPELKIRTVDLSEKIQEISSQLFDVIAQIEFLTQIVKREKEESK